MIRLISTSKNIYTMTVQLNVSPTTMWHWLQQRGYIIKPFLHIYTDETFPGGTEEVRKHTWTATKPGQEQTSDRLYTKVFRQEMQQDLAALKEVDQLEVNGYSFEAGV